MGASVAGRAAGAAWTARSIAVLLALAGLFLACSRAKPPSQVAFYHWKQVLELDRASCQLLAQARVQRLFVRFFDVDLDAASGTPVPVSELEYRGGLPAGIRVIPVVFLAERVFRSAYDPSRLAGQVAGKIERIVSRNGFAPAREIQLDCDWTESSQDRFFSFLKAMKKNVSLGTTLSATLRLHQVKFREREGVPPVDCATLMLYNMGDVESPVAHNSIIDAGVFRSYADALGDYPLPFDLALPIYRWGLVYRHDRLARIVNDLGEEEVAAAGDAFRALGKGRFLCRRGTHLGGTALFAGDLLRLEAAEFSTVRECQRLARKALKGRQAGLVFYHLDAKALARFGPGRVLELAREI
ncbi:MAG: hypothetical protein MUF02_02920 [Acidobacteria bacterium]|jgi:hypothetical protein|nr:hypothetical protein [Acidobacteriota bacterium]